MKMLVRACAVWLCLLGMPGWAAGEGSGCPPVAGTFTPEMFEAAAAQASDRGLLWRVSKGGRSSYLYGTLHVGKAQWMAPGPLVRRALQQTDMIGLELDPLDATLQAQMAAAMAARAPTRLPEALQARLKKAWEAECLPAEALGKGPVEMQVYTLMFMAGRREGFDPSYGSEVLLALIGHGGKRPVVSLESVALQVGALLAADEAEAQAIVRDTLDDLEAGRLRTVLLKTVKVWEEADLAEMGRYFEWCECFKTEADQKLMKRLLDDRNPGLAASIDELHGKGRRLFAAVGAMHMVGPQGIPALLAARGYQVERLR